MQSFDAKCDAIVSLLSSAFQYQDYSPVSMRTAPQKWVSERSPLDPPYVAPASVNPHCNGRCYTCLAYFKASGAKPDCPPEEKWMREYTSLRLRYRIGDVEDSLFRLSQEDSTLAQAVWAVHVEPWPDPKTEPIAADRKAERDHLAHVGVEWMAEDIEGDVLAMGEKRAPIDNEIRRMHSDGFTNRRIARELRCRPQKVQQVLEGVKV